VVASYHRHCTAQRGIDGHDGPVRPLILEAAAEASHHNSHGHDRHHLVEARNDPFQPISLVDH